MSPAICFNLDWSKIFPNKPWILHVCSTSLSETLWEKEKLLLLQSIFPFHSVFSTLLANILPLLSNLILLPANSFSLEDSKKFSLGKGLKDVKEIDGCDMSNSISTFSHKVTYMSSTKPLLTNKVCNKETIE